MATTVISLRHNSIKENLMTLHIFWFICRNSLSRIITFSSVSSWVCKLGMCFLWVLIIFHARVNIPGLHLEYLVKQIHKNTQKVNKNKDGNEFYNEFQSICAALALAHLLLLPEELVFL